jgi:hypothetical protein
LLISECEIGNMLTSPKTKTKRHDTQKGITASQQQRIWVFDVRNKL